MTQNYENYDKRFQQCIDELVVLEKRAEERAEKLLKDHTYYQKKAQETADDLAAIPAPIKNLDIMRVSRAI